MMIRRIKCLKLARTNVGLWILAFILIASCKHDGSSKASTSKVTDIEHSALFQKIRSDKSKISFRNDIKENLETLENLFNFDYFYNGAGVGLEDLNNDGLLDIFFTGNQVDNELYLNKGNLVFENISSSSKINVGKRWSNGITFVDINNDGWMDIYISQGGPNNRSNRNNLLYINNQDNTFSEQAETYGLADAGISTQSAFFDYDGDGDLDCIVMNENELYGVDPITLYNKINSDKETQYFNSSHFYKNENGKFVDYTEEAGLARPIFGLGLSISDVNLDGFLDIYIASDYYIPDALFINNGDGTFSDKIKEYTKHTSFYGMGIDIADVNNDNLQDIFVLDMASKDHFRSKTLMASMSTDRFDYLVNKANFHYQYMFNSLHLNIGNNKFNNIAQLTKTANTDWSWSVLLSDYDNDGFKDIFVTNGYRRYALDNDLQRKVFDAKMRYKGNVPLEVKRQLYNEMPSEKLQNIIYHNKQNLKFEEVGQEWGLTDFSFSNGAAQGDLDNDGDLDIVINNMDEEAFLYQNLAIENNLGNYLKVKAIGEKSESFPKIKIKYSGKSQFVETKRVRGYMSAHENVAHFGLGLTKKIDTLSITWQNGNIQEVYNIDANTSITVYENDAKIVSNPGSKSGTPYFNELNTKDIGVDFVHKENFYDDFEKEILLPYKQSLTGPFISKGDINSDGKTDIYIGGASGQSGQIYLQTDKGFINKKLKVFEEDKNYEDAESVFFDFDNDSDLDLFVVSGGNEFDENSSYYSDRLYLNDGDGNYEKYNSSTLSSFPKSGRTVDIIDFDKDGDKDIIVGNRIIPENYPKYSPSTLYENIDGKLKDVTSEKAAGLPNFGIINSIKTTDFNNDGWEDFIAVGEWTTIGLFENREGTFFNISEENEYLQEKGWWFSVHETDINKDGLKDYVIGNTGLNIKFTASKEKPFKIYANDFDDDGINDIVLSKKYNETYVPVRGRECSSQQMPFIKEKFGTYTDFANATLEDIYGEKLNESYKNEVTEFKSILLVNKGEGVFEKRELPVEAQTFPIMDCVFYDFNNDGFEDCLVAGNLYETEVETPRLDAISGLVLLSNGKNGYVSSGFLESGLYFDGNVKSLQFLSLKNRKVLFAGINNGPVTAYELTSN